MLIDRLFDERVLGLTNDIADPILGVEGVLGDSTDQSYVAVHHGDLFISQH